MKWILRKKSKATAIINEAMHHTHPSLLVHIDYRGTWIAIGGFYLRYTTVRLYSTHYQGAPLVRR